MCPADVAEIPDLFSASTAQQGRAAGAKQKTLAAGPLPDTLYVYRWDRQGRKGQPCRVTARGKMNSCRVEFADRWMPSSKTCSECGSIASNMPLSKREWTCAECGTHHDRDENAATNLELVGAASPKPLAGDRSATRGETGALAFGQPKVKRRSVSRELKPARFA